MIRMLLLLLLMVLMMPYFVIETRTRAHRYGLDLFGLLGRVEETRVRLDDVALEMDRIATCLGCLQALLHGLFGVYCGQTQHEQIHGRGQRGQADQNEQNGEARVSKVVREKVLLLQWYIVTKSLFFKQNNPDLEF